MAGDNTQRVTDNSANGEGASSEFIRQGDNGKIDKRSGYVEATGAIGPVSGSGNTILGAGASSDVYNIQSVDGALVGSAFDLSADIAAKNAALAQNLGTAAFDLSADTVSAGADLTRDLTGRVLDTADASREDLMAFIADQSKEIQNERNRFVDASSNLALRSFDLADEKTQSADDRVFSLGRVALYAGSALAGLFLLIFAFRGRKPAA